MEEGINDRKDGKNEKNDEEKEAVHPYETSPVYIEEGISAKNDDRNEKKMSKKRPNAQMTLPLLRWRKV